MVAILIIIVKIIILSGYLLVIYNGQCSIKLEHIFVIKMMLNQTIFALLNQNLLVRLNQNSFTLQLIILQFIV